MDSRGRVALPVVREAVRRLHAGWTALPVEARRRWWTTLGAGAAGVVALTVALVWAGRHLQAAGALSWERGVVVWFDTAAPLSFSTAVWLEAVGNGFLLWAVMLYAAGVAAWHGRPLHSLAFLVGYTLVYLPIALGWWMWDRPRPEIIAGGIGSPGGLFRAYPSGHTIQTVFAYGLLFWLWLRATGSTGERIAVVLLYLGALAAVVFGRMRMGAHWPSDIVAGALIGFAWLGAVVAALVRAERASR